MNARKLYQQADYAALRNGRTWYTSTGRWCARLSARYDVPIEAVAGIVAVLSQRKRWRENRLEAVRALQGKDIRALGTVRVKVKNILAGRVDISVKGPKIRAFWRAILGDPDAVVLDSWMLKAYGETRKRLTPLQYSHLANKLRRDAAYEEADSAVFQAVVWCVIRGAAH